MKMRSCEVLILLLVAVGAPAPWAQSAGGSQSTDDAEMRSYRASADFALTADPRAPSWKSVQGVEFEQGRNGEPIPGHHTEVRSRWTDSNLYLLFICRYEDLYLKPGAPARGETSALWDWDVAEAFIGWDFERINLYKEFEVSPRSEWIDLAIEYHPVGNNNVDASWNSGFTNRTRIDKRHKTWYAEMRIPLASIASWKPDVGRALRINLFRIQGSKPRKLLCWRPVYSESFHQPKAFGKLVLAEDVKHSK
jgi:hypothetical protein